MLPLWQSRSLCATAKLDPRIFFPEGQTGRVPKGQEGRSKDKAQREVAERFCKKCPTESECLEYAIAEGIFYQDGVYGGKTEEERRVIIRRREKRRVA